MANNNRPLKGLTIWSCHCLESMCWWETPKNGGEKKGEKGGGRIGAKDEGTRYK